MTVLAWDYFLVYQIKDIRNGKTSSRLWKVLAFLSVKQQKEAQKFGVIYRTGWQEMLRAREQDSCGICVHMCFPSYGKKEKKKKRTLPVFDTQNCFFFFF